MYSEISDALEKVKISSFSMTIEKYLSPEIKHYIYRKYKDLAHPPEGIRIRMESATDVKFYIITREGALMLFDIDATLFKMCGITAEDVEVNLKLKCNTKIRTPNLVTKEWWNSKPETEEIDAIELANSVLTVTKNRGIVWYIRDLGNNGTLRVLNELLKVIKIYKDAVSPLYIRLLNSANIHPISPNLNIEFPFTDYNGGGTL